MFKRKNRNTWWHIGVMTDLPEGEGAIGVFLNALAEPNFVKIPNIDYTSAEVKVIHGIYCKGRMTKIPVSSAKSVLLCEKCALRISVPLSSLVGDLMKHLENRGAKCTYLNIRYNMQKLLAA